MAERGFEELHGTIQREVKLPSPAMGPSGDSFSVGNAYMRSLQEISAKMHLPNFPL